MTDKHKRTPLEETFDIPSIHDVNEQVTNTNEIYEHDDDYDYDESDDDSFDENDHNDRQPDIQNLTDSEIDDLQKQLNASKKDIEKIKEIDHQNRKIRQYDNDVQDIHKTALKNFEELMSTSLNMEAAHGSKYLGAATKLLSIALDAKNSSFDRHLKMIELQLQKEKIDNEAVPRGVVSSTFFRKNNEAGPDDNATDTEEIVGEYDRNSLVDDGKAANEREGFEKYADEKDKDSK